MTGLREEIEKRREYRGVVKEGFEELVDVLFDHLDRVDAAHAARQIRHEALRDKIAEIAENISKSPEDAAAKLRALATEPQTEFSGLDLDAAVKVLVSYFLSDPPPNYINIPVMGLPVEERGIELTVAWVDAKNAQELLVDKTRECEDALTALAVARAEKYELVASLRSWAALQKAAYEEMCEERGGEFEESWTPILGADEDLDEILDILDREAGAS